MICCCKAALPTRSVSIFMYSCSFGAYGNVALPPGAAFTVSLAGSVVYSGTLDGSSRMVVPSSPGLAYPAGPYTVKVTGWTSPRYVDATFTITSGGSYPSALLLQPAPGYVCNQACGMALSNRMILTYTAAGTTTNKTLQWGTPDGGSTYGYGTVSGTTFTMIAQDNPSYFRLFQCIPAVNASPACTFSSPAVTTWPTCGGYTGVSMTETTPVP
jgi:hypothetical protein